MDDTSFTHTCNNFSVTNTSTLTTAGSFTQFFTNFTTYCSLISNKPVLVTQFGVGRSQRFISGDPIMSIVPSVDQHSNIHTFSTLNFYDVNLISVSVRAEHYQPNSIHLDGQPIVAVWNAIYDSRRIIVGYGCHVNISRGSVHTVRHDDPSGRLAVMVYGFSSSVGTSYGYLAGLSFTPMQSGTQLYINIHLPSSVHLFMYTGVALPNSFFGVGSGPVQLSNVQCSGSENSLLDCSHNLTAHCPRFRDAGVTCPGK